MLALARAGYAAKGVVYIVVGWLAALAAFGHGGTTTDAHGALEVIYQQPLGRLLLGIVAIGLFGYAGWSLVRALVDPEGQGADPKGLAARAGCVVAAVSYAGLAWAAAQLILGSGSGGRGSDASTQDWTAQLLALPFGRAAVIAVALVVLGAGLGQLYAASTGRFARRLDLGGLPANQQLWVVRFGRTGRAARGVVFASIAAFLVQAALQRDAGVAVGLGGALERLATEPDGDVLLGVVAVGLLTYGLFSCAEARWRRLGRA